jgi:O-antigen/teichoic acid export membrane protein
VTDVPRSGRLTFSFRGHRIRRLWQLRLEHCNLIAFKAWLSRHRTGLFGDLITSATASIFVRVLGAVFLLATNLVLARVLGPNGAGLYYLAFAIVTGTAVLSRAGLDVAAVRLVAVASANYRPPYIAGLQRAITRFLLGTSAATTVCLLIFAPFIAEDLFGEAQLTPVLRVMAAGTAAFAVLVLCVALYRGLRRPIAATILETAAPAGLSLFLLLALAPSFGARGAALALVLSWVSVAAAGWIMFVRRMATSDYEKVKVRSLLSVSLPLLWTSGMNLVLAYGDVLMLGALSSPDQVGVYSIALRVAIATNVIAAAVTGVASPQFAQLWAAGQKTELKRLACASTAVMTLASLPLLVFAMAQPARVMSLFGEDFRAGAAALIWVAAGQLAQTAMGAVGTLLVMTGHERDLKRLMLVSVLCFLGLNALLIPKFGATGAGAAFAISLTAMNVAKWFFVRHRLGITVIPLIRRKQIWTRSA